jgi:hypothetical protein
MAKSLFRELTYQFREKVMRMILIAVLGLASLSGAALAEPGGGTDRDRVNREVEAMQRDGRWEQLIAEGQANKQAFDDPSRRQTAPQLQAPTATGSVIGRRQ